MAAFAKYRHAFLIGLQSNIIYRWSFSVRALFALLHLAFVFILWGAAYEGKTEIGGFALNQTLTYFIAILLMQFLIGAFNEDYQISEDIRNGLINQFLLKPINYYAYRFSIFVAARFVTGLVAIIPLLVLLPLLKDYITLPFDPWRFAIGIPAMILAALIQFTIAYIFGLLTFWFLEIQSFIILSLAFETILGGQIVPLDLLPDWFLRLSQWLPYYYQLYFPTAIFTGRLDQASALQGLALQVFWAGALLGLAQLLWVRGLRRHTAVGG